MPPQLVALTEGPNILLDKPILLLGRHQECDIQLASRKISRRHCCIAQVEDYLVIRDLCSTNGIRINGIRVTEGCLREGDELTLGNHRYQVNWNTQQVPAAANPPAAVPGKEAVRRTRAEPAEDDAALESCDVPVPLAEPPGGKAPALPSAPAGPAPNVPALVVPPEFDLAPGSEPPRPPSNAASPPA
jgi:predicted component of type VI protein secretion system